MAKKGSKTGPFPESPRDIVDFRYAQIDDQKTFKRGSQPEKGFGGYSVNATTERDHGPYGRRRLSESGAGNDGNNVMPKDRMEVPTKARPFSNLPTTKPPKGNIKPIRGEHPHLRRSNQT